MRLRPEQEGVSRSAWAAALAILLASSCYREPLASGFESGLSPKEACKKNGALWLVSAGPGDRTALVFTTPEPNPPSTPATVTYEFQGGVTTYSLNARNGDQLTEGTCAGTAAPQVFNAYSPVSGKVKLLLHAPGDSTAYELSTVGVTLHLDSGSDTLPIKDLTLAFPKSLVR